MQPRVSRHNIPCSFCGEEFFPGDTHWYRWRQGKPTYCGRTCVKAKHAAEAHSRNPDRPCTTCGKEFTLTPSQRNKVKNRPNTGLYCSTECLHHSRGLHSRARWESGEMPAWGSPAQKAAAKRLGEYSRIHKVTGPAHPQWKGGAWTNEAKADRARRSKKAQERRAAAPKEYPCAVCEVWFEFNSSQRQRWYKHGASVRYCCSHCRSRSSVVTHPPYYYAPAECAGCTVVFTPNQGQRGQRHRNPDVEMFCSDTCVGDARIKRLAAYREVNGVMAGPTHPSWKTGSHSKEMQEARNLMHQIKKFINQGAKQ